MRTQATQTDPNELYRTVSLASHLHPLLSPSAYHLPAGKPNPSAYPSSKRSVSYSFLSSGCCPIGPGEDLHLIGSSSSCPQYEDPGTPLTAHYRHQFVIRTIPSYLSLSPRASYHRLNLKHPASEMAHEGSGSGGDTILLCSLYSDPLWAEPPNAPAPVPPRVADGPVKPPIPAKPKHISSLAASEAAAKLRERTMHYAELLSERIMQAIEESDCRRVMAKWQSGHTTEVRDKQPLASAESKPLGDSHNYSYRPSSIITQFIEHRSFSENELYLQAKDECRSSQNIRSILATELTRRHSAIADLAVEPSDTLVFETIATPPPGFKDTGPSEGGRRRVSAVSPESDQSSQVTSVTNCSDLLQTTGTTFSSDATGSGLLSHVQPEGDDEQLAVKLVALGEGPSGMFTSAKVLPGGRILMGQYNLDFDDDDEERGDSSDQRNLINDPYRNADFAEGSSQDEEERAKYEFEFETEEEEMATDEQFEEDPPFEIVSYRKADCGKSRKERPSDLPLSRRSYSSDNSTSDEECRAGEGQVGGDHLDHLPPPPPEYVTSTPARVSHGSSKSLPENLYRSAEEDGNTSGAQAMPRGNGETSRLMRAKSSTIGRRHSRKVSTSAWLHRYLEESERSEYRLPQRYDSEGRDLTPVQDICSSDPSTAVDLSVANTVIEKQMHRFEEENDDDDDEEGEGEDGEYYIDTSVLPLPVDEPVSEEQCVVECFSGHIFGQLGISEPAHSTLIGGMARRQGSLLRQDTFDETFESGSSYSRREDIPLLSGATDATTCGRSGAPGVTDSVRDAILAQLPQSLSESGECAHCNVPSPRHHKCHKRAASASSNRKCKSSKGRPIKSKYDPSTLRSETPEAGAVEHSESTLTSSVDSDSMTLSVENLPEDSTTSGSFMLDDSSPYTDTLYGIPFLSECGTVHCSKGHYSSGTDLFDHGNQSLRLAKPGRPVGSKSLPSNIDHLACKSPVPSLFRTRFEQRNRGSGALRPKAYLESNVDSFSTSQTMRIDDEELDYSATDNFFGKYQQILDSQAVEGDEPGGAISTGPPAEARSTASAVPAPPMPPPPTSHTPPSLGQQTNPANQTGHHPAGHHHHLADVFEQCSQATERDVERSEFSLQHQNSELDDDESLTFENLNNQSLSVIDEDSRGVEENEAQAGVEGQAGQGDEEDKLSNVEERDLSLEAVLHEESKQLEESRAGRAEQTGALDPDTWALHSSARTNALSCPTLQEATTCPTSTAVNTEDSSRDLVEPSSRHERTELRDERVALLPANDSSEYTHSATHQAPRVGRQTGAPNEPQADRLKAQVASTEETTTTTLTFSSTCSHNGSTTFSECSSATPDQSKREPVPILKQAHQHRHRHHHRDQTCRSNVVFASPVDNGQSAGSGHCVRCHRRHPHHRHPTRHHHPPEGGSRRACHHHRGPEVSFGQPEQARGTDQLLEQARARSLTRTLRPGKTSEETTTDENGTPLAGPDAEEPRLERQRSPCNQHHFTCNYCGESSFPPSLLPVTASQSRLRKRAIPALSRKSFTIEDVYFDVDDEESDLGVHTESYRAALWIYIGRREELAVWGNRNRTTNRARGKEPTSSVTDTYSARSESEESTASEKVFRKNYESVTHRLIHRKASIELYRRILDQTFAIDKCLTLMRDNNEFGFRIHGSRPVVVSAIEKGTSAEHKGLEVGDIVVSVNNVNVLDSAHSEVVKLAHTGSSKLTLEVASTAPAFKAESTGSKETEHKVIINGYLKRFVQKLAEQFGGNTDKMTNSKLWRRRWFVLRSDSCLYWYRNPKSVEPIGAISLQGYCAGVVNECLFGQEHLFRLVGYGSTTVKYFAAIDHDTALQWVKALNQNSVRFSNSDAFIEQTLHNIHRNPLNFVQPDCYGFLLKFNQLQKSWKQRYFVLKDACFYFYADANSNTALGLFYLHGYKVQACAMLGKKHTFEVVPANVKFRHIWLCADSDADKKRWLAALEYSIDRWIRLK